MVEDTSEALARSFWQGRPGATDVQDGMAGDWFIEQAMARYRALPYLTDALMLCFADQHTPRVLEVGCGLGFDGAYLVESGAEYTGVDFPLTVLHAAKSMVVLTGSPAKWNLKSGDARALPMGDAAFDVVYSFGVLHHIPAVSAAIKEITRVLKKDGRLVAMVYNYDSIVATAYRHDPEREGTNQPYGEGWTVPWSMADIHQLLSEDFKDLSVIYCPSAHDYVTTTSGRRMRIINDQQAYHMLVTGVKR